MHPKLDDEFRKVTFMSDFIHLNDKRVHDIYIVDTQEIFVNVYRKDLVSSVYHQGELHHLPHVTCVLPSSCIITLF